MMNLLLFGKIYLAKDFTLDEKIRKMYPESLGGKGCKGNRS